MTDVSAIRAASPQKKRMANMELLRIVAMMMVIVLHYLGKGGILSELTGDLSATEGVAWLIEAFAAVAVNVYMLISGYFLVESSFKISRVLGLVFQALFYSILVPVILVLAGVLPLGEITFYQLLYYVFPTQMEHYWFLTAYVVMYLISPLLRIAVHHMSQKQHALVLGSLLVLMSLGKSLLPVRLEMDEFGYDAIWFICVFLLAAYIRLYGISFFRNKKISGLCYASACLCVFGVTMALNFCYVNYGIFGYSLKMAYHYNHVLNLLGAVSLFYLFYHLRLPAGKFADFICRVAPYTFGVYLLHEQTEIKYLWPIWLGADRARTPLLLAVYLLLAVCAVFVVGILADMLRAFFFRVVGKGADKLGLSGPVYRLDAVFARQDGGEEKKGV